MRKKRKGIHLRPPQTCKMLLLEGVGPLKNQITVRGLCIDFTFIAPSYGEAISLAEKAVVKAYTTRKFKPAPRKIQKLWADHQHEYAHYILPVRDLYNLDRNTS